MNVPAKFPKFKITPLLPWLDTLALLTWGALLLKYWLTGQLNLLIHPNYFGLVLMAGLLLLFLSILKLGQLLKDLRTRHGKRAQETVQHITLFPPGLGSLLLVIVAMTGFMIAPTVLTSQTAMQRGITETLPLTRSQPQSFRDSSQPEDRSLIEWIRTLNTYPEPDEYTGQKAKISGFVVHLPQLPDHYLILTRFVLTCCAVDAYPVGIPVKLPENNQAYPPDTWLEIEGEMFTETLSVDRATMQQTASGKRQLVLAAKSIKKIPTPADPYSY